VDLRVLVQQVCHPQAIGRVAHGVAEQDESGQPHGVGVLVHLRQPESEPFVEIVPAEVVEPGRLSGPFQYRVDGEVGVLRIAVGQGGALDFAQDRFGQVVDADLVGHRNRSAGVLGQRARYPPSTANTDPVV
jgi:hypothetical protein